MTDYYLTTFNKSSEKLVKGMQTLHSAFRLCQEINNLNVECKKNQVYIPLTNF